MLRRVVLTAAVASIVAVVLGGASLAVAGGTSEDTTFSLVQVQTGTTPVDLPPSGPSVGDEFVLQGNLKNSTATTTVGTYNVVCIALSTSGPPFQCSGVLSLKAGQIHVAGDASGGPNFTVAITGGTRRYDEANGQIVATPTTTGNELLKLDIDR